MMNRRTTALDEAECHTVAPRAGDGCQLCACQQLGTEHLPQRLARSARWLRRAIGLRTRVRRFMAAWRGEGGRQAEPSRGQGAVAPERLVALRPVAGDHVRVRPASEIAATLDQHGRCHGCAFLKPMLQCCGREFRVLRVVSRFFDEAQGRMLTCRNIVLLEGAFCDGSGLPATRGCDRMCFLFWRTEWLERVAPAEDVTPGRAPLSDEAGRLDAPA